MIEALVDAAAPAFADRRALELARSLVLAHIVCLGRHTLAGVLCAAGRAHVDWSAAYRLFERDRIDPVALLAPVRALLAGRLPEGAPLLVGLDDTLLPRCGMQVADAAWRHDPQGPPFAHQVCWGQRVLQLAVLAADDPLAPARARAVPVDTLVLPHAKSPGRKASREALEEHRRLRRAQRATAVAAARVRALRAQLDREGQAGRRLHVAFDGGYTNKELLREPIEGVTMIGRIRKDARLCEPAPPREPGRPGRPRKYGPALATPGALLADDSVPWQSAVAFAAGQAREFQFKCHERCCWAKGALGRVLRVVVVRPLEPSHDRVAGRRLFFAHPAYLVCTDPDMDCAAIIQAYVQRWEIEVGFREQKTTLGVGEGQAWKDVSSAAMVRFQSWCHSLLVAASLDASVKAPPPPKWRKEPGEHARHSARTLVAAVRGELWGRALGAQGFGGFVPARRVATTPPKPEQTLPDAVLYGGR